MHQNSTTDPEMDATPNRQGPLIEGPITDEELKRVLRLLFERDSKVPEAERVERAKLRLKTAMTELGF
jgi:hypothetical protein